MMPDLSLSSAVLPAILLGIAAIIVFGILGVFFAVQRARLPEATRLWDLQTRIASAQTELAEKQEKIREAERSISERDRYAAEAEALKRLIEDLKLELDGLADARREIDAAKSDASEAAAELARVGQELETRKAELDRMREELDPARLDALRAEVARLTDERAQLEEALGPLRAERDAAWRLIEEATRAERRLAEAAADIERLEQAKAALAPEVSRLQQEVETARADRASALGAVQDLQDERSRLDARLAALRSEVEAAVAETERLSRAQAELGPEVARLRTEVDAARADRTAALDAVEALRAERSRLDARVEALRAEAENFEAGRAAHGPAGVVDGPQVDPETLLADLRIPPAMLSSPPTLRDAPLPEPEALHALDRHLDRSGLRFSTRVRHAFHTALKINDFAQLTVLAGVSGTGKSLLPRKYAEALGIHFLQIAVEPRWDSPQDLLGFHNYVEGKYRATDLARLLYQTDPLDPGKDKRDHVSLVLLDEMNLARVEYYFSEFLSRLEARPRWIGRDAPLDPERWRDATIPLDVRGLSEAMALRPGHGVLFAGTMNDDESTQALSDKVLDRGNVMQFAAPRNFPSADDAAPGPAAEALPLKTWRGWINAGGSLGQAQRERVERTVGELAGIMDQCGRPFGFRLRDSIQAYAANYPHEGNGAPDVDVPLADQIEFRILPKLRGVEIGDHRDAFERLGDLVRDRLGDAELADRLGALVEQQESSGGLFVWRGLTRDG